MPKNKKGSAKFHIEFRNATQKLAWAAFQQNDILFLSGPAGCGKTYLASAFAVNEVLQGHANRIVLTRPIVEAGESLGYLPGTFGEKVTPYMMPLYDCISKAVGPSGPQREVIDSKIEVAPLAYLRGRTLGNSICILDEAQNCTLGQLKLYLTRLGEGSKMIVTGDPDQTDIGDHSGFIYCTRRLEEVLGVGIVKFDESTIVRHPLVGGILSALN